MGIPTARPMIREVLVVDEFDSTPLLTTLEDVTGKPPREAPDRPEDKDEVPLVMLVYDVS